MKAVLIGDVHLADHPPSIRKESYLDEILAKLEFAVAQANEIGADALIQAGDLCHVKAPSRTSHALVQKTIDVLSKAEMEVLVIPGNHDMQNDRIGSLQKQPLGTICKAPGITMLMGPHPTLPVFGLPYLYDYPTLLPKWMRAWRAWRKNHAIQNPLMVTHAPLFPPGEKPIYDFIAAEDWADLMEQGSCYYGHIHDPHGDYVVGGTKFCNNGAISRGSLHEQTLKRKPAITLWTDDLGDFTWKKIDVPHLPANEVFRLSEKEDADAKQELVKTFLDGVEQTVLEVLTVEEVVAHAEGMGLRDRTLHEIRDCIEFASSQ